MGIRKDDVVYSPFPLYHSVTGMLAMSGCFHYGFKYVLRKKFSASKYWKDCIKYNVTVSRPCLLLLLLLPACFLGFTIFFVEIDVFHDKKRFSLLKAGQYIGEICRYLLNTPYCPEEQQHKIRLMFGNGLRPQIWSQFVNRFNIPNIAEFYGSTEGNSNISKNFFQKLQSLNSILMQISSYS